MDTYHLGFHLNHPTHFNLSVRCTTQFAVISLTAQVAANASGEVDISTM